MDIENIWLSVTASDADSSQAVEIGPLHIDNNSPPSVILTFNNMDSTYVDSVDFVYALSDAEDDTLSLFPYYSIDGGVEFKPAEVSGILTGILPQSYKGSLQWNLSEELPEYYGDILFMLLPSDRDEGIPDTLMVR